MKAKTLFSSVVSLAVLSACAITANAQTELAPTDNVHKFDIGSDNVGGSGVEDGSCWIKVVQSSNKNLRLFEDIGPEVNVTALAVTFEISDWSGTEFPITWGANIDFFNDESTTWCGTSSFEGISEYTISGNGEYTLVCDLSALCSALGKDGISNLQTCEMVIRNVEENDPTVIEVKSARIYVDGEAPEDTVIPSAEEQTDSTSDTDVSSTENDSSSADSSTSTASADTTSSSSASSEASTANTTSTNNTATAATTAAAASDTADKSIAVQTGASEGIAFALLALSVSALVISKRK